MAASRHVWGLRLDEARAKQTADGRGISKLVSQLAMTLLAIGRFAALKILMTCQMSRMSPLDCI